ncbi:MAG: hypothetical protein K0Q59_2394 [Paenibacillus sp.]|nr:hypothetical protein [Paenibacillus sp.]
MDSRKQSRAHEAVAARKRSRRRGIGLIVAAVAVVGLVVFVFRQLPAHAPSASLAGEAAVIKPPPPPPSEVSQFRMTDYEHGWMWYTDGVFKTTSDGGATWTVAAEGQRPQLDAAPYRSEWSAALAEEPKPQTVTMDAKSYAVKQSQFLTNRLGWALVEDGSGLARPLLLTTDGGQSWQSEVTAVIKEAVQAELQREALVAREAALYDTADKAKQTMRAAWTITPNQTAPGDIVLVRHDQPGEVDWQGKKYTLQPFGSGYYTYLPVPLSTKTGVYPIGDQQLTVKAKRFETQYLQVSEQLESMRQDTNRIIADQKKIDLARSKSAPEFLFDSPFVQPVQGILTTPYGYTRYVNGKYDSSHLALDLAAKEGTPIKATNDGIVVLSEMLYLTGNSIYIDHGMGLFSQYAHMSELRVKTGDRVKKGDIIGLVGTTGFSTGPHLHFTFWAHNVQANPNLFFDKLPTQWAVQP